MIDLALLAILLFASVYTIYFMSQQAAKIFFLVVLVIFLLTKKDYFWFAFFFIIIAQPGWLFKAYSIGATARVPIYTFLPSTSLTPMDLFVFLVFVKALVYGRKCDLIMKRPLTYVLLYGIFLLVMSIVVYGSDINVLANMLRSTFMYSAILSFLFLIYDWEQVRRFMHLIFPVVFFILFTQVYFVLSGNEFVNLLSAGQRELAYTETGMLRPVMGGVVLIFFAFAFSLFLLQHEKRRLTRVYLYVVMVLSCLSIFMSATRIWVIMFSLMLLFYLIFIKRSARGYIHIASVVGLLLLIVVNVTPLKERFTDSWVRVSRLSSVMQGRFSVDTSFDQRYSVRLPHVVEGIKQNWLLGWGFSDSYVKYNDAHVGNFNMLLQVGIIGFMLFSYLWWGYFKMVHGAARRVSFNSSHRRSLQVLLSVFTAMLVAHFSTYQFFGLSGSQTGIFFVSIFLAISQFAVRYVSHRNRAGGNDDRKN
ncbi:MAG: hypothetical protein JSV53_03140 [candidate division WOR-3 bacterium]|nr:MAG: hypothetical protein JSV53_03140 [candidate division WOR-3 bacterium]